MTDETPKVDPNEELRTWRTTFWATVRHYVEACGGDHTVDASDPKAGEKVYAVREIESLIANHPGVEQQLRLDLAGNRLRANSTVIVAHSLVGIAQRMATGDVTEEQKEEARKALADVSGAIKRLVEVKA